MGGSYIIGASAVGRSLVHFVELTLLYELVISYFESSEFLIDSG